MKKLGKPFSVRYSQLYHCCSASHADASKCAVNFESQKTASMLVAASPDPLDSVYVPYSTK